MPGEVINEAILIIASIVLIGALVGSVYVSITYIGGAMTASSIHGSQKLLTDIQIDYATNITSTVVAVYIQNTGSVPVLSVPTSTVYFGQQNDELPIGFNSSAPTWNTASSTLNPGETMSINITAPAPLVQDQYYSLMYVTPNGISASYTLQVA
jgi:archaeal flagellar protein FlaG